MLRPSNLPDYVDRGNEQVFRPPYQANRTGLSVILLSANKRQLDQIVQRELTDPTGRSWQFSAASSWLVFMVADIQRLQSVDPRDMQKGWVSEREVSVWLPIWDHRGHRAAWYLPYLFSNSAAAVLAGREVFGYPKAPASIHFEGNDPLCGFRVEVDAVESAGLEYKSRLALALKCNQSGTSEGGWPIGRALRNRHRENEGGPEWASGGGVAVNEQERRPKLVLAPASFSPPNIPGPPPGFASRVRRRVHPVDAETFIDRLESDAPLIFLKQFRDARRSTKACYQALIEAHVVVETEVSDGDGGGVLGGLRRRTGIGCLPDLEAVTGDWTLFMKRFADLRLAEQLGLVGGSYLDGDPSVITFAVPQVLRTPDRVRLAVEFGDEIWAWHE